MSKKLSDYVYVEENIYKTKAGTYRVRVGKNSINTKKLTLARAYKKHFKNTVNSGSIW